jgi:hypothetical protein
MAEVEPAVTSMADLCRIVEARKEKMKELLALERVKLD